MKKFNIDQAFRDRLKDYQETPDERVWESISASLDKKKSKKRVIPIWWRLGGMAAALALLFYLFLPLSTEVAEEQVTDTEQPEVIEKPAATDQNELIESIQEQDALAGQDEINDEDGFNEGNDQRRPSAEKNIQKQKGTGVLAATEKRRETQSSGGQDNINQAIITKDRRGNEVARQDSRLAQNKAVPENITSERGSDPNKKEVTEVVAGVTEAEQKAPLQEDKKKKSIFEAIEEQEEEVVAENNSNRWAVGPMVAPVYFNTLTEGSPIHSNFAANNKSGNVNLSYGVAVSYKVSKKLSLRSGVHRVDYGYDTNEIEFSSSLTASTSGLIDNIDYNENSRTLVVESQTSRTARPGNAAEALEVNAPSPSREGRMVQDFGYLEIPVELQYTLVDRKLGINLIGGVSSLFLTENSVTLVSDNTSTSMGEANNINEVNFSTNFGLGMYYRLTPKMQLNLEPMFKYQLNTFSESAGNFQPFSVGVYSGLSFRF
jgi:hypothetical protein